MHQRRSLPVRNPTKPTKERLPCRLTTAEESNLIKRTFALERTIEEVEGQVAETKAKAKAKVAELQDKAAELGSEKRKIREQVLRGEEDRLVDCEVLEDVEEGNIYIFRLDTGELAAKKDMRPEEREQLRQHELPLEERVTRTVDIFDGIPTVKRFDSDPPGVEDVGGEAEDSGRKDGNGEPWQRSDDATADLLGLIGRDDITFETVQSWTDEQIYVVEMWAASVHERVEGEEWPDAPAFLPEPVVAEEEPEPKPKLKKGGRGKRNGEGVPAGTH